MEEPQSMRDFLRLIQDFERLAFHFDVATLYGLFFARALPVIGLACIALGLLASGYALPDASGNPRRAFRRVALAGALSLLGMALYTLVPLWLDSLGITPSPTHLRFYGMFFLPIGALAGVLAVLAGSARRFARRAEEPRRMPFSLAGFVLGFVVMWIVFLIYSRLILGVTMNVPFGLIRATATAVLGALLFAFAPYLIHVVEHRPATRLLSWGYGLLVTGAISLLVAQVVTQILSLRVNII
jgi:hypothetical protein